MLRGFIVSLRARHRAILLTTHDLDEAQRIADRVVVLYKGRVLRTGATADVRAAGRPIYTVAFAGDAGIAREALRRAGIDADSTTARDGLSALRFAADDPAAVNPVALRALLDAGMRVITLSAEERSLEDAYLSILAEARR
jgi:ABC-2 type transport system ATP-binding protein